MCSGIKTLILAAAVVVSSGIGANAAFSLSPEDDPVIPTRICAFKKDQWNKNCHLTGTVYVITKTLPVKGCYGPDCDKDYQCMIDTFWDSACTKRKDHNIINPVPDYCAN